MTVPARRPIPIPGSTAAIIVVAGAVMTEEVSINIMLLVYFLPGAVTTGEVITAGTVAAASPPAAAPAPPAAAPPSTATWRRPPRWPMRPERSGRSRPDRLGACRLGPSRTRRPRI